MRYRPPQMTRPTATEKEKHVKPEDWSLVTIIGFGLYLAAFVFGQLAALWF